MEQTQQQQQNQLPHRFRESAFRQYEAIIAAVVKGYPNALSFNPGLYKLSSVTFSCRLRDAIKSWNTHHWPTSSFDKDQFDRAFLGGICVSEHHDTATVSVGSKASIRVKTNRVLSISAASGVEQSKGTAPVDVGQIGEQDIVLLAILAERRALSCEVHFSFVGDSKVIPPISQSYDCSIESLGKNNKYSIL